jgi:DNA primase
MNLYQEKIGNISLARQMTIQQQGHVHIGNFDASELDNRVAEQVFRYYQDSLRTHPLAQRFLQQRHIAYEEAIANFRLGFADRTLGLHLQKLSEHNEQRSRGALQRVGLLKPSGHEFFRGSLVFPFVDATGKIVGAYGRRITPKLKYDSVYHVHWITDDTLFFNTDILEKCRDVIICKNPVDAVTLWCFGYRNVVAIMGARSYSALHAAQLAKYHIKAVHIAFGSSREEILFARKIATLNARHGIATDFLLIPLGMDANDLAVTTHYPEKLFAQIYRHPYVLKSGLNHPQVLR